MSAGTELPKVIKDMQVLHRADTQGPRITRVQTIAYKGKLTQVNFWHDANGRLLYVK